MNRTPGRHRKTAAAAYPAARERRHPEKITLFSEIFTDWLGQGKATEKAT
jgi:hypothetical protein